MGPVGPVTPVSPVAPVGPVGPVGPVTPVSPVAPVGPIGPVGPVGPDNPVAPTPAGPIKLSDMNHGLLVQITWDTDAVSEYFWKRKSINVFPETHVYAKLYVVPVDRP